MGWFSGLSLASKSTITLVLLAIIAAASCRALKFADDLIHPDPPKPPKQTEYYVVEVLSGASILCSKKENRRREVVVYLKDVAAPADGEDYFAESRDHLKLIAGSKIKLEQERRRGLLRGVKPGDGDGPMVCTKCPVCGGDGIADVVDGVISYTDPDYGGVYFRPNLESRGPIEGVVYGASNKCLQEEQLRAGLALQTADDVPDSWEAACKYAQDNKLGLWATTPIPPEPVKSKWASRFTWYAVAVFVFLFGWFVWDIYGSLREVKA